MGRLKPVNLIIAITLAALITPYSNTALQAQSNCLGLDGHEHTDVSQAIANLTSGEYEKFLKISDKNIHLSDDEKNNIINGLKISHQAVLFNAD